MNRRGVSLVEVLVAASIMAVVLGGLMQFSRILGKQQTQSNLTFQADTIRKQFTALLNNAAAWQRTIRAAGNSRANGSALDCLIAPGTPCTVNGSDRAAGGIPITNYPVRVVLNNAGAAFYDSTVPSAGFTATGASCNSFVAPPATGNDACPFRFNVTWTAVCSPTSCLNPQVNLNVAPIYNPSAAPNRNVAFNSQNYSANLIQGAGGRMIRLIGAVGNLGAVSDVYMGVKFPGIWNKVLLSCTPTGGPYCNPATGSPSYVQVPFTVQDPTDFFIISAAGRSCTTTTPSTNCQLAAATSILCSTPGTCTLDAIGTGGANARGFGIFVFDPTDATQYFYQDISFSNFSMHAASGTVFVTGLLPGNYMAELKEYEFTANTNYLTFTGGRQLAVYQLQ